MYYIGNIMCDPNYLEHHGILGMKWGVRRYQNEDGTLTSAGKARYGSESQARSKGVAKAAGVVAGAAGAAAASAHVGKVLRERAAAAAKKAAKTAAINKWASVGTGTLGVALGGPVAVPAGISAVTIGGGFWKGRQIARQRDMANHLINAARDTQIRNIMGSGAAIAGAAAVAAMLSARHKKNVSEENSRLEASRRNR